MKKLEKIQDYVIFILIILLYSVPFLKLNKHIFIFMEYNYYNCLILLGSVGLFFLIKDIYFLCKKYEDKKVLYKKILLPIILLTLYMVWTYISAIMANNQKLAFHGTGYRKEGYITYILYAGCFGLAFSLKSEKLKKLALNLFSICAILLITVIQLVNGGYIKNVISISNISQATFLNLNHFGYYLLIATALSNFMFINETNKIKKVMYCIMYIFLLYFLILNNTFGCYIAFTLTLVLYFIKTLIKKEKIIFAIVSICIFAVLSIFTNYKSNNIVANNIKTTLNDTKKIADKTQETANITNENLQGKPKWRKIGSGRGELWYYGVKFILEKPILGYGPENLEAEYKKYDINQDRPHNIIIQLATTSGIPGLLLYASAIGVIIYNSLKKTNNSIYDVITFTVIAYLISAFFGNSMYNISPFFFTLIGFLENQPKGDGPFLVEKNQPKKDRPLLVEKRSPNGQS